MGSTKRGCGGVRLPVLGAVIAGFLLSLAFWKSGDPVGLGEVASDPNNNIAAAAGGIRPEEIKLGRTRTTDRTLVDLHKAEDVTLIVFVRSTSGLPVVGAKVYDYGSSDLKYLGATNPGGEIEIRASGLQQLAVKHNYFTTQIVDCEEGVFEYRVTLVGGGEIAGYLRGAIDNSDWIVAAVPQTEPGLLSKWTESRKLSLWTSTVQSTGEFHLTGLDPSLRYQVVGCGPGAYAGQQSLSVLPGPAGMPEWVDLEAQELWAAHLVFDGPDGLPAEFCSSMNIWASQPRKLLSMEAVGLRKVRDFPLAIRAQILGNRGFSQVSIPEFFVRVVDGPFVDGIASFAFQLPGYLEVKGYVQLEHASPETMESHFPMVPLVEGWGVVELEVLGTEYLQGVPPPGTISAFELLFVEAKGSIYTMYLPCPIADIGVLNSVPAGVYAVTLRSREKVLEVPLATIEAPLIVMPGGTATLSIELGNLGSVHLEVFDGGVEKVDGSVGVFVVVAHGEHKGEFERVLLNEHPFVIRHLSPGSYYLWLDTPFEAKLVDSNSTPSDTVQVMESWISKATIIR
jgi:hypothetical protein